MTCLFVLFVFPNHITQFYLEAYSEVVCYCCFVTKKTGLFKAWYSPFWEVQCEEKTDSNGRVASLRCVIGDLTGGVFSIQDLQPQRGHFVQLADGKCLVFFLFQIRRIISNCRKKLIREQNIYHSDILKIIWLLSFMTSSLELHSVDVHPFGAAGLWSEFLE